MRAFRLSFRASIASIASIALLAGALAFLGGCRTDTTPIKTLLDDPSSYDGKKVRIAGDVTGSVGLLGYGAYQVNDGTGSLVVVSKEGGAPREGAKVGVEGTFRAVFTLKTESVAALEESRRTAL
jgi:hypothetical protein